MKHRVAKAVAINVVIYSLQSLASIIGRIVPIPSY